MSHNKMLIDATHPEETRVVVLRNGRVEEFDFESAARKLLRGNIYLAKVTRVEPSLQAAFIDYGGNRHGFLAFNEIHPDYYTIPVADRQALLEEEAAADAAEEAEADARAEARASRQASRERSPASRPSEDDNRNDDVGGSSVTGSSVDDRAPSDNGDGQHGSSHDHVGHDHASHDHPGDHTEHQAIDVTHLLPPEPPVAQASDTGTADEIRRSELTDDHRHPHDHGGHSHEHPHSHDHSDQGHHASDELAPAREPMGEIEEVGGNDDVIETVGIEGSAAAVTADAGGEDAEEMPVRPRRRPRSYKIQEVIKRRQIILIQIVKEERGTKGAALTTYLSLAGRYTVLMPNTARGGGISRKITNAPDRKRLKAIAQELEVPEGMGLIIRTAGAARTKQEIKRDFEYLLRLWESVRDMTLQSTAPSLVYEEGDLIKRSIRDLYTKDVEDVYVAGDHAFKDARDFMAMLMPSHARNVIDYKAPEPLFSKFGIEKQLNAMFSPIVNLRSGGYLVINQTEALVAIDINSGKSTREFNIEATALNTNLEAAEEIARQLKLRDLAGLIVIDFIDMEEKRNNRAVERCMKDALRFDRARIQVGHISHFGLLEMSRQRLRTGVLEGSTTQCSHCQGTGIIRSVESAALGVIRGIEDALILDGRSSLVAHCTATVALYILNNKRSFITDMEARYGVSIAVQADDKLQGANHTIDKTSAPVQAPRRVERAAVNMDWGFDGESDADRASVAEADHGADYGNNVVEVVDDVEDDSPQPRQRSRDRNDRGGERSGSDRGGSDRAGSDRGGRGRDRNGRRGSRDGGGRDSGRNERGADRNQNRSPERVAERTDQSAQSRDELDRTDVTPFENGGATAAFADVRTDSPQGDEGRDGPRSKRRRRRRGRRGDRPNMVGQDAVAGGNDPGDEDELPTVAATGERESDSNDHAVEPADGAPHGIETESLAADDDEGRSRRSGRRRGRRGGRRNERDGLTEGNADGSPDRSSNSDPHIVGGPAISIGQAADDAVMDAVAPVAREERPAPTFSTQALEFSRDGDHPEKPDQFEPAPAPKPVEAPKPKVPKNEVVEVEAPKFEASTAEVEVPKPRRSDPVAGAPVLARVVVSMDGTPAASPTVSTEDKPVRKGWWQRKLAGE
jgi:ribonuclease E